ncbi:hypothetical protein D3868_14025 [Azospirillum brasilense]|uniref:Uncharacterized protein n=2 Tax=Azospirillum brasilense TaxID=192 RepID=A0A4D8QNC0_AZOBR|nr:hypothetical protein D3868_14025 [Azospirillum brasilense]
MAARAMYFLATIVLILFALVFVGVAAYSVLHSLASFDIEAATHRLLDGVGMIVLAIAIFEIAKYLYEEEIVRDRELRHADEAAAHPDQVPDHHPSSPPAWKGWCWCSRRGPRT